MNQKIFILLNIFKLTTNKIYKQQNKLTFEDLINYSNIWTYNCLQIGIKKIDEIKTKLKSETENNLFLENILKSIYTKYHLEFQKFQQEIPNIVFKIMNKKESMLYFGNTKLEKLIFLLNLVAVEFCYPVKCIMKEMFNINPIERDKLNQIYRSVLKLVDVEMTKEVEEISKNI